MFLSGVIFSQIFFYFSLIVFFIFNFSPDIFILDDPTSSLDNKVTELILKNILTNDYWSNRTFIISTNNLGILKNFTRIIYIRDGRIIHFDTPERVKDTPEFSEISIQEHEETDLEEIENPRITIPMIEKERNS